MHEIGAAFDAAEGIKLAPVFGAQGTRNPESARLCTGVAVGILRSIAISGGE
jgi:hypothetical protein